jgi:hypothetical protein
MININNVEIKVYPLILESDQASALWHLMRVIDLNGSGKVSLTFKELIDITGYTKSTIYRYMKSPLFNKICKNKNRAGDLVYSFYYKSLKQVALTLNINNLITSSFCMWEDIKQFYIKRVTATEIIAESIQNRSRYVARNNKDKSQHLLNISTLFSEEQSSVSDNTQGIKKVKNRIYYTSAKYAPFGASQKTISTVLNRNIKTVNKRLKNTDKIQQFVNRPYSNAQAAELKFMDGEQWTNNCSAKFVYYNNKAYERYTNIYNPQYALKIIKLSKPQSTL